MEERRQRGWRRWRGQTDFAATTTSNTNVGAPVSGMIIPAFSAVSAVKIPA